MLLKIFGAFLLVIGLVLAVPLALTLVVGAVALAWTAVKVGAVALLIYIGWRWINRQGDGDGATWKAHG